jgi:hypothetical protein
VDEPKVMVPNESRETFKSVVERVRYSIPPSHFGVGCARPAEPRSQESEDGRCVTDKGEQGHSEERNCPLTLTRFFRLTTDDC